MVKPVMARAVVGVAAAIVLAACAGPSRETAVAVNRHLAAGEWSSALRILDAARSTQYGERDVLLYWLDKASVLHDAGRYAESDQLLDLAERRMEELYTVSISKSIASFVVSEPASDYAGQIHERVLLHVLRALNYAYLGKTDEAVVEARKVTAFLAELNDRLGEARLAYRDDAFAQYLSGLLFEDQGRVDDARICFEAARTAYSWYPAVLGTSPPDVEVAGAVAPRGAFPVAFVAPGSTPSGTGYAEPAAPSPGATSETTGATAARESDAVSAHGELVLLHYAGVAPRLESRTFQVAWRAAMLLVQANDEAMADPRVKNALVAGLAAEAVTVAIPVLVQDPFVVQGSAVEAGSAQATTVLMEDVSAIARSAFQSTLPFVQAKAIVRAAVKFLLVRLVEEESRRKLGNDWGSIIALAGRIGAAATETADTRSWRTLPAQFRMARLRLPAGVFDVKVRYLTGSGMPLWQDVVPSVEIRPNRRTYVHVRTAR